MRRINQFNSLLNKLTMFLDLGTVGTLWFTNLNWDQSVMCELSRLKIFYLKEFKNSNKIVFQNKRAIKIS